MEKRSAPNSEWIEHVKNFALKHNIKYGEALRSPDCQATYHASKSYRKKTNPPPVSLPPLEPEIFPIPTVKPSSIHAFEMALKTKEPIPRPLRIPPSPPKTRAPPLPYTLPIFPPVASRPEPRPASRPERPPASRPEPRPASRPLPSQSQLAKRKQVIRSEIQKEIDDLIETAKEWVQEQHKRHGELLKKHPPISNETPYLKQKMNEIEKVIDVVGEALVEKAQEVGKKMLGEVADYLKNSNFDMGWWKEAFWSGGIPNEEVPSNPIHEKPIPNPYDSSKLWSAWNQDRSIQEKQQQVKETQAMMEHEKDIQWVEQTLRQTLYPNYLAYQRSLEFHEKEHTPEMQKLLEQEDAEMEFQWLQDAVNEELFPGINSARWAKTYEEENQPKAKHGKITLNSRLVKEDDEDESESDEGEDEDESESDEGHDEDESESESDEGPKTPTHKPNINFEILDLKPLYKVDKRISATPYHTMFSKKTKAQPKKKRGRDDTWWINNQGNPYALEKGVLKGGALIESPITRLKNYAKLGKAVINGRDNYQPKAREILTKYGNEPITKIELVRAKVPGYITGTLNVLSLGKFDKNNKEQDKNLYHLAMLVSTPTTKVLLEKNEVINIELNPKGLSKDRMNVSLNGKSSSINQLLHNAEKRGGKDYWSYSASEKNCQEFVRNILYANDLNTPENIQYTNQDTQHLFKDAPRLKKISDTITGIAAKANVINEGAGRIKYQ